MLEQVDICDGNEGVVDENGYDHLPPPPQAESNNDNNKN